MQEPEPFVAALHRLMAVFMHRSFHGLLSYARESGLSMPQMGALMKLHHRGNRAISDLGEDLGVTSSAASQMLDRMVHLRLILRSEDPSDRRVRRIVLTDRGRQALQGSIRARECWLSDLAAMLSDSEKQEIIKALNTLTEKAVQLERPGDPDCESNWEE